MWYESLLRPGRDNEKRAVKQLQRRLRKLSMTGRLCYLFLCVETFLTSLYPERDWTPVARRCWPWTEDYWNKGWDAYSVVVPEWLLEFDGYEQTNAQNYDGALSEDTYNELTQLFAGLTTGEPDDELNRVLMLPIDFSNACEGAGLTQASSETMAVFEEMQKIFARHSLPLPDMDRVRHLTAWDGWGGFFDSTQISLILNP